MENKIVTNQNVSIDDIAGFCPSRNCACCSTTINRQNGDNADTPPNGCPDICRINFVSILIIDVNRYCIPNLATFDAISVKIG